MKIEKFSHTCHTLHSRTVTIIMILNLYPQNDLRLMVFYFDMGTYTYTHIRIFCSTTPKPQKQNYKRNEMIVLTFISFQEFHGFEHAYKWNCKEISYLVIYISVFCSLIWMRWGFLKRLTSFIQNGVWFSDVVTVSNFTYPWLILICVCASVAIKV